MAGKSKKTLQDIPKDMTIMDASVFWDEHSLLDYEGVKEAKDIQFDIHSRVRGS